MAKTATWRQLAYDTLREHGPMSKEDLSELLGDNGPSAARSIATARHERPGEFFRIIRYVAQRGNSGREIPIYAAGSGPDAKRPDFASAENVKKQQADYYRRNRAALLARRHANRPGKIAGSFWGALLTPEGRRYVAGSLRAAELNQRSRAKS